MRFRFSRHKQFQVAVTFLALTVAGCGGDPQAPSRSGSARSDSEYSDASPESTTTRKRILFFGDSITAGYGLDPEEAFPALIQEKIDDREWPFEAVNAGLSGETTAGGLRRIDWMLKRPVDILVLELGGNDGLRGIPVGGTRHNLLEIIKKVKSAYPEASVIVAGMRMPPNLGRQFADDFAAVFPDVAEETGAALIPFIGKDILGRTFLVQMDGIHPTASGHEVIAETVWEHLEPILLEKIEEAG